MFSVLIGGRVDPVPGASCPFWLVASDSTAVVGLFKLFPMLLGVMLTEEEDVVSFCG